MARALRPPSRSSSTASIGGPIAAYGAFLHVVVHAAAKTLAFFGAGELLSRYESREVDQVRGVMRAAPFTGASGMARAGAGSSAPPTGSAEADQ